MTAKTRIMATLAGFVVIFLLGWLFYGIILMDFFASNSGSALNVMRAEDDMVWWALILGNLLQSYFLVYVFGTWTNISSFGNGFKSGAILGLIIGFSFNLTMYGTTNNMNLTGTLVDPFVAMIMMGVTGGVIGVILGKK